MSKAPLALSGEVAFDLAGFPSLLARLQAEAVLLVVGVQKLSDVDSLVVLLLRWCRLCVWTRSEWLRKAPNVMGSRGVQPDDLFQVLRGKHGELRLACQLPDRLPHLRGELLAELGVCVVPRGEELHLQLRRIEQQAIKGCADPGCHKDVPCRQLVGAEDFRREDLHHLRERICLAEWLHVVLALIAVPLTGRALEGEAGGHVCSAVAGSAHALHPQIGAAVPQAERMDPLDGEDFPFALVVEVLQVLLGGRGAVCVEGASTTTSGDSSSGKPSKTGRTPSIPGSSAPVTLHPRH
ncbi:hypothetical protein ACWCPX_40205 [Streptomyces olivaceoviridis]